MKDHYTEIFLKSSGIEYDQSNIKEYANKWWFNLRDKQEGGLRLTEEGIEFIEQQAKIKTYAVEIPKELTLTPQILIWLDKYIKCPYFLSKKEIRVLTEKSAFELYLFSGDIKKLGLSKTMHKHFQESLN
jgi:hypothetical protein